MALRLRSNGLACALPARLMFLSELRHLDVSDNNIASISSAWLEYVDAQLVRSDLDAQLRSPGVIALDAPPLPSIMSVDMSGTPLNMSVAALLVHFAFCPRLTQFSCSGCRSLRGSLW
ncbi:hypothetical protein EON66_05210, partial [archaeon]